MDDCDAIKTRRAAGMISRNLMFRDCVLWNDCANGFEIGYTSQADLLENVTFRDSSLILGGRSAFSLHVADHELRCSGLFRQKFQKPGVAPDTRSRPAPQMPV